MARQLVEGAESLRAAAHSP